MTTGETHPEHCRLWCSVWALVSNGAIVMWFPFVLIIAIANLVDMSLGDGHLFRDASIFFYLADERLSILENAGPIGLDILKPIRPAVELLKGKYFYFFMQ